MGDQPTVSLVLDCRDPEALATFWVGALGYENVGAAGNYVVLMPEDRPGPKLVLQKVPEAKVAKNRMHFDVETPDIETTAARLEAAGGTRITSEVQSEHGSHWILMADPEGNEFCVCDGGTAGP